MYFFIYNKKKVIKITFKFHIFYLLCFLFILKKIIYKLFFFFFIYFYIKKANIIIKVFKNNENK